MAVKIPLRFTVGVRAFSSAGSDAHGNAAASHAAPVIAKVYGWADPGSQASDHGEPGISGQDRLITSRELYAPAGFVCGPNDRIVFPDGEFDVLGYPEDYNHGPFGYKPGFVVNCRRVEG